MQDNEKGSEKIDDRTAEKEKKKRIIEIVLLCIVILLLCGNIFIFAASKKSDSNTVSEENQSQSVTDSDETDEYAVIDLSEENQPQSVTDSDETDECTAMDILGEYIQLTDPHDHPGSVFFEPIIEEISVPMFPDAHIYYVKYEESNFQDLFYINTKSRECKILNDFYWCYNVEVRIIESRVYLIACKATHMGNGEISVFRVTNDDIEELVRVDRGVDRNWDSASNAVYENGYLETFIDLTDTEHPDMEFEGIENVYGSFEEGTANKSYNNVDKILYQRWNIYKKYTWSEEENKYILIEDERTLIQQMEGVYPIPLNP